MSTPPTAPDCAPALPSGDRSSALDGSMAAGRLAAVAIAAAREPSSPSDSDSVQRSQLTLRCHVDPAQQGRWSFELRGQDGQLLLSTEDIDPDLSGEPLELIAVIRGLESLDEPSQVTLVGSSRYVRQGIRHGLPEWRRQGWQWEWFGQMVPIRHERLWRRLDSALRFHRVEVRTWRFDHPHLPLDRPHAELANPTKPARRCAEWGGRIDSGDRLKYGASNRLSMGIRRMLEPVRRWSPEQSTLAKRMAAMLAAVERWLRRVGWFHADGPHRAAGATCAGE